ncbi:DUF2948 family protein [Maricaulis sp. CAU 1757]
MSRQPSPLRLVALDADDLPVISATLQDAVALLGDFEFSARRKQFTMAFNRYRWEAGKRRERVRTGIQVGEVLAARSQNIRQGARDAVVSLLAIGFEPHEDAEQAPAGSLVFTFSGGGELRLDVACIDLVMADLTASWKAVRRPRHDEAG